MGGLWRYGHDKREGKYLIQRRDQNGPDKPAHRPDDPEVIAKMEKSQERGAYDLGRWGEGQEDQR